ncbi:MAG TPA: hemolysin family protein [Edaphocola sp.]|nr:hemolysin family protein [Edaphocola sp.]
MISDIPPSVLLTIDAASTISSWNLFLTILLVFINGFFVAAEFAIVKVRTSQLEILTNKNKSLVDLAKNITNNLDAYLAATQLGITLASLGLGWVGESTMTALILRTFDLFGLNIAPDIARRAAIPIAFGLITILHIVFGELAPKSLAIRYPTRTTLVISWPLRVFYFIFRPIIWLMNGFANAILRMLGIKPIHGSEIHSEEELKMIITESQEGGAIEETERNLIQNVFDFDDRRVINIQTLRKNISALEINTSVVEALDYAITEGYTRFPVYEENLDNIKGLVYTKDLVKKLLAEEGDKGIGTVVRKATFINETTKIKNLLKLFQKKHLHMAVVTNEIGELTGIVTMEDILEELVGEIQDEYDNEKPIVEQIKEGVFIVEAHHSLSDLNKYLPHQFDESEHYDTLAGLISELYEGREPKEGDILEIQDSYKAEILKMYRNSAEKVKLILLEMPVQE